MMRFTRPAEPSGFAEAVAGARERIESALLSGGLLNERGDFPDVWSRYKEVFARAQHGKCGYCERDITTSGGDVEHFRPKAGLDELPDDLRERGREDPYTGRMVSSRRLKRVCERGYSWLAYEWTNYLLACASCNQKWKRCLFPVAESPRPVPPTRTGVETPLLLSPFGPEDPADHLEFTSAGGVTARGGSAHGRATIDTCGLDRDALVRCRAPVARDVDALLMDIHEAVTEGQRRAAVARLREKGDASSQHAGMVRSMVATFLGVAWSEIQADG